MQYDPRDFSVSNFVLITKHFFVPGLIEVRKPLGPTARRAGWIGCRILLRDIPSVGQIFLIKEKAIEPKEQVLAQWVQTLFLRDAGTGATKNWLLQIMKCIEKIAKRTFTIDELYAFQDDLARAYPENRHIREKMRQQLQVLRDKGYLEFTSRGTYRLAGS